MMMRAKVRSKTTIFGLLSLGVCLAFCMPSYAESGPQRVDGDKKYEQRFSFLSGSALVPPSNLKDDVANSPSLLRGRVILAQSKRELGQGIAQNTLRVDQLEERMRSMNGRIEELLFEIRQLREQLRLMQEDNEFRFQELEGGQKRSDLRKKPDSETSTTDIAGIIEQTPTGEGIHGGGVSVPDGPSSPVAPADNVSAPLDLSASRIKLNDGQTVENGVSEGLGSRDPLLQPNGVASLGTLAVSPNDDPEALYNLGYTNILNGDYEGAEKTMREFVTKYSQHPLAADAQYWLGETFYARGRYNVAVQEFSNGYKTFPESGKAPDTLLKLGLSLAAINEIDAACATLREVVNRYPNAPRSIHLAARDQQALTNCAS